MSALLIIVIIVALVALVAMLALAVQARRRRGGVIVDPSQPAGPPGKRSRR